LGKQRNGYIGHKKCKRHHDRKTYSSKLSDRLWGQTASFLTGRSFFFLVVKQAKSEADHSSSPRSKVKNEWNYTSTPPILLNGPDKDNFPFLYKDKTNPITDLDRPRGFQENKATIFQDNRHMKVVKFSALGTGHLYSQGNISVSHFC
jgi:hypothetical protein